MIIELKDLPHFLQTEFFKNGRDAKEVAKALCKDRSTINYWTSGRSIPTYNNFIKILDYIEYHIEIDGRIIDLPTFSWWVMQQAEQQNKHISDISRALCVNKNYFYNALYHKSFDLRNFYRIVNFLGKEIEYEVNAK